MEASPGALAGGDPPWLSAFSGAEPFSDLTVWPCPDREVGPPLHSALVAAKSVSERESAGVDKAIKRLLSPTYCKTVTNEAASAGVSVWKFRRSQTNLASCLCLARDGE